MTKTKQTWKNNRKNRERAERAEELLNQYQPDPVEQEQDYTISDLICDLLHLAASRKFDTEVVMQRAQNHYDCESIGMES